MEKQFSFISPPPIHTMKEMRSYVGCVALLSLFLRSRPCAATSPIPGDIIPPPRLDQSPSLKVCILVEPSPFTFVCGYANRYQETLRYLSKAGDQVVVITADNHNTTELPRQKFGQTIHHTAGFSAPFYRSLTLSFDWKLKALRVIHKMKPHVLHVSTPGLLAFAAIFYSRLFGIPLVMSYHTHLPTYAKKYRFFKSIPLLEHVIWGLIRFGHSFADVTLVTSPQIKEEFVSKRIPRVYIWQKGINTERFHPRYSCDRMRDRMTNAFNTDFLLLYVGRLAFEKRVHDLKAILDAAPSGTRLCLVGTGPQEEETKRLFKGDHRVVFTGQLVGDDLSSAYASADVLVLPSDSETLGFVVLEAMASGVPVVAARAGGVPNLIEDNLTSFLVTPGATTEYVGVIQKLRDDPDFRKDVGLEARKEAEKWGWEASTSVLRSQYWEACQNYNLRLEIRASRWLRHRCGQMFLLPWVRRNAFSGAKPNMKPTK